MFTITQINNENMAVTYKTYVKRKNQL